MDVASSEGTDKNVCPTMDVASSGGTDKNVCPTMDVASSEGTDKNVCPTMGIGSSWSINILSVGGVRQGTAFHKLDIE
jgi:hypothetical protein